MVCACRVPPTLALYAAAPRRCAAPARPSPRYTVRPESRAVSEPACDAAGRVSQGTRPTRHQRWRPAPGARRRGPTAATSSSTTCRLSSPTPTWRSPFCRSVTSFLPRCSSTARPTCPSVSVRPAAAPRPPVSRLADETSLQPPPSGQRRDCEVTARSAVN